MTTTITVPPSLFEEAWVRWRARPQAQPIDDPRLRELLTAARDLCRDYDAAIVATLATMEDR